MSNPIDRLHSIKNELMGECGHLRRLSLKYIYLVIPFAKVHVTTKLKILLNPVKSSCGGVLNWEFISAN